MSFVLLKHLENQIYALLTFSLLISADFWVFLSFPSDRSIFGTFFGGYENTAIAEKREETQKSSLISKEKVNNVVGQEIWTVSGFCSFGRSVLLVLFFLFLCVFLC